MISSLTLLQICALLVALSGATTDLFTHKIPNRLTFSAAAIACIMQFLQHSWYGLIAAVSGWLLAVIICVLPLFLVQWLGLIPDDEQKLGFGDVKLIAAIGAFLGPLQMLFVYLYFSFIFGFTHCVRIVWDMPWKKVGLMLKLFFTGQKAQAIKMLAPGPKERKVKKPVPIAPAIAGGVILAYLLDGPTRQFFGVS